MSSFFPRHTVEWRLEEPAAFRKLSLSLLEMAVLTGVVLRLYRAIVLSLAAQPGWLFVGVSVAVGAAFLAGMATLHLGNYPVHRWLWRAPLFGLVAAAAELATSLGLVLVGREPMGTGRATRADWASMVPSVLLSRVLTVVVFALVLAGVVQLVRVWLLRREHRDHTLRAVHEDHVRQDHLRHEHAREDHARHSEHP
jgi:hypothetical protein